MGTYVFVVNHETRTLHKGLTDGNSTKFDPRCNIPTARKEGAAGTETVSLNEANALVDAGYRWCEYDEGPTPS